MAGWTALRTGCTEMTFWLCRRPGGQTARRGLDGGDRENLVFVAASERSAAIPTVFQHKLSVAVTQRAAAFSAVHLRLPPMRRCCLDALDHILGIAVRAPERFSHGWTIARASADGCAKRPRMQGAANLRGEQRLISQGNEGGIPGSKESTPARARRSLGNLRSEPTFS